MSRTNSARAPHDPADIPCAGSEAASTATTPRDASWRGHIIWLRTRLRGRFSAELADDLAQETYLRIVGRDSPITADNPRGLLITIATNLARDVFRRDRVRADYAAHSLDLEGETALRQHTAEDDLQVREAILSLPPQLRDVLLLSKIGGLTNREIAQRYREDEVDAWRASRDHSPARSPSVVTRHAAAEPPPEAKPRAVAKPPEPPPPARAAPTAAQLPSAPAGRSAGAPPPRPPPPSAATGRGLKRRRSQHAQAIAQQMLLDF